MSEAQNDAVQFLYKHGDLTYSAASDAIAKLCNNGFRIVRSDLCVTRAELDQMVGVCEALRDRLAVVEKAIRHGIAGILNDMTANDFPLEWSAESGLGKLFAAIGYHGEVYNSDAVTALQSATLHRRNRAMSDMNTLLDTADRIVAADLHPARLRGVIADLASALRETTALLTESKAYALALEKEMRDRGDALRVTGPNSDNEYWLHIKAGGRSGGINLGAEHGPICARLLEAAATPKKEQSDE